MGRNIYYALLAASITSCYVLLTIIAIDKGWI